jgi:hypothetical protein
MLAEEINTTVITLYAQDEQDFSAQIPLTVQQNIVTFDDEQHEESLKKIL